MLKRGLETLRCPWVQLAGKLGASSQSSLKKAIRKTRCCRPRPSFRMSRFLRRRAPSWCVSPQRALGGAGIGGERDRRETLSGAGLRLPIDRSRLALGKKGPSGNFEKFQAGTSRRRPPKAAFAISFRRRTRCWMRHDPMRCWFIRRAQPTEVAGSLSWCCSNASDMGGGKPVQVSSPCHSEIRGTPTAPIGQNDLSLPAGPGAGAWSSWPDREPGGTGPRSRAGVLPQRREARRRLVRSQRIGRLGPIQFRFQQCHAGRLVADGARAIGVGVVHESDPR